MTSNSFYALMVCDFSFLLATAAQTVGLLWWIAEQGGAPQLAIYAGTGAVTSLLFMPLLSPLADRVSRGKLVTVGSTLSVIQTAFVALAVHLQFYSIAAVVAAAFLSTLALAIAFPASLSLVRDLVSDNEMTVATGLQQSAQAGGRIGGAALGGIALGAVGMEAAFSIVAMIQAVGLVASFALPRKPTATQVKYGSWACDLRSGLVAKWVVPIERGWGVFSFLMQCLLAPAIGMFVPLKLQAIGGSSTWLGICEASMAIGVLLAALKGSAALSRLIGRFNSTFGALIVKAIAVGIIGLSESPGIIAMALLAIGASMSTVQIIGNAHRMVATPPMYLGRMISSSILVMQLGQTVGAFLAGMLLVSVAVSSVYILFGAILLVNALLVCVIVPGYREFLDQEIESVHGHYERTTPHAFR